MPEYEVVYTETRSRLVRVMAPDEGAAYEFFHNSDDHDGDCVELGNTDWQYFDEETDISVINDATGECRKFSWRQPGKDEK